MDCKTARYLLDFNRPSGHDLDAADRAALDDHLAVCPDCDSACRAERQLDEHLGRAVRDVPIPHGLQERILGRLRRQRDEWWLEGMKRTARYAAVAAVLLLAVFGWLTWKEHHKPTPSGEELVQEFRDPFVISPPTAREARDFFARKGHKVDLPPQLDYKYLTGYDLAWLKGRDVPRLRFIRFTPQGSIVQYAEVYILTSKQFNLSKLKEYVDTDDYRAKMVISTPSADHAYVIVHTGDLNDLRQQPDVPAE